jgi:hypothetical protein
MCHPQLVDIQCFPNSGHGRGSSGGDVMMSAKKRVRQSEYARRRSCVELLNLGLTWGGGSSGYGMDIDPE